VSASVPAESRSQFPISGLLTVVPGLATKAGGKLGPHWQAHKFGSTQAQGGNVHPRPKRSWDRRRGGGSGQGPRQQRGHNDSANSGTRTNMESQRLGPPGFGSHLGSS
jgi:hypothetical protein